MSAQSLFPYKHIVLRPHLIPAINLFFPRNQRNRYYDRFSCFFVAKTCKHPINVSAYLSSRIRAHLHRLQHHHYATHLLSLKLVNESVMSDVTRNRPDPVPISASSKGLSEELYGCGLAFLQKAAFLSAPASLLGMTCFFSPKTWMQKSDDPPGQTKT
ncbi:hypothetical protein SNOG_14663 [Parastagonospora nodorum SN15]|uniref:Uncharacterized protein n=2 Tax=Phaeosphaeria nodorum (strain SN15 / ATCC MYA-4574 / FGSC 10173) TaxID=321614 RepID=A0A7U2NPW5_PHANO|nr:hypothetical protein SNOG_14663 [Parastagonospora nodorum SN15]EAT77855.1 hypothetical protein SNOG_14663 [Parastagonospora nodorum SN15]QRD06092.1 hypothetical protein JI435_146630 [Parastagonospora nodorum SN15]